MKSISWFVLMVAGCAIEAPDLSLMGSDEPYADLYDDGSALVITGCARGAFLGCTAPSAGETMTATLSDGTLDVPVSSDSWIVDQLLGLVRDGPFELETDVPADGGIGIEVDGASTSIELPPASFGVVAPPSVVSRAAGPIAIEHDIVGNGTTEGLVVTTCSDAARSIDFVDETTPGALAIDLSMLVQRDSDATCTHEIHVDQTVGLGNAGWPVAVILIDVVEVTSTP